MFYRPHLKTIMMFLLAFVLTAPGWMVTPALASDGDQVLALVNQERVSRGLAPLTLCKNLTTAAQKHTDDMIARQFFDHTNPDGHDPFWRIMNEGYNFTWAGENIAVGYPTAANVIAGWMSSSGHRANILSPNYTHMGIGFALGNYMGFPNMKYWTQTFGAGGQCGGSPIDLAVSVTDSPDPVISGQNLTYTIVVTNTNVTNAATQADMTDLLPANVTYISATPTQGSCLRIAQVVDCALGNIAASGSATVTLVVKPTGTTALTNSASASSGTEFDTNSSNSRAVTTTTVVPPPPPPPNLVSPLTSVAASQPVFTWSIASTAIRYEIQIDATNPPATTIISVTSTSYTAPAPMLPGVYYWRVRAYNSGALPSNWSTIGSFTLNSPAEAAPPRAYFTSQPLRLTWARVTWAEQYELEVYSTQALTPVNRVFNTTTSSLSANVSGLQGGIYYWRVRALSSTITGAWSSTDTFALKP